MSFALAVGYTMGNAPDWLRQVVMQTMDDTIQLVKSSGTERQIELSIADAAEAINARFEAAIAGRIETNQIGEVKRRWYTRPEQEEKG